MWNFTTITWFLYVTKFCLKHISDICQVSVGFSNTGSAENTIAAMAPLCGATITSISAYTNSVWSYINAAITCVMYDTKSTIMWLCTTITLVTVRDIIFFQPCLGWLPIHGCIVGTLPHNWISKENNTVLVLPWFACGPVHDKTLFQPHLGLVPSHWRISQIWISSEYDCGDGELMSIN